jgi:hypothetical protein
VGRCRLAGCPHCRQAGSGSRVRASSSTPGPAYPRPGRAGRPSPPARGRGLGGVIPLRRAWPGRSRPAQTSVDPSAGRRVKAALRPA